jgi:hypothetical protein
MAISDWRCLLWIACLSYLPGWRVCRVFAPPTTHVLLSCSVVCSPAQAQQLMEEEQANKAA